VPQRLPKSDLHTKDIALSGLTLPDQLRRIGRAVDATFLAHVLGVSRLLIYKRASAGRIPCFRIGSAVRFDPSLVARWLEAQ
jgi:excisionase family DNA binding protein